MVHEWRAREAQRPYTRSGDRAPSSAMSDLPSLPPPPPVVPDQRASAPGRPVTPGPTSPGRRLWIWLVAGIVVLVVAAGASIIAMSSDGGSDSSGAAGSSSTAAPALPPTDLKATPRAFTVVLTWRPPGGMAPSGYRVYRNDELIESVDGATRRYVDTTVLPGTVYRYEVRASDAAGRISAPASLGARTPRASAALARLSGVFDVRLTKTSSYGVTGISDHGGAGWRFTPSCGTGPCSAKWADIRVHSLSGTAKRSGASYRVSTSSDGLLTCSGTPTTSQVNVTVHVVKAGVAADEWRAVVIEGTMNVSNGSQLGCRSSGITYQVRGTLVR